MVKTKQVENLINKPLYRFRFCVFGLKNNFCCFIKSMWEVRFFAFVKNNHLSIISNSLNLRQLLKVKCFHLTLLMKSHRKYQQPQPTALTRNLFTFTQLLFISYETKLTYKCFFYICYFI